MSVHNLKNVLLLAAVSWEVRGLVRGLGATCADSQPTIPAYRCRIGQTNISIAETGVGKAKSLNAACLLLEQERPDVLVSFGMAGSLGHAVKNGDIVIGNAFSEHSSEAKPSTPVRFRPSAYQDALLSLALQTAFDCRIRACTSSVVTVDSGVFGLEEKKRLGELYGALAVEMETSVLAQVAAQQGIPFLSVRCISDGFRQKAPRDIRHFIDKRERLIRKRIISGLVTRPVDTARMLNLIRTCRLSCRNLEKFFSAFLPRLCATRF